MATRVSGVKEAQEKLKAITQAIKGKKLVRGVRNALYVLAPATAAQVPVDTSTLLNSQYRRVDVQNGVIIGRIGYSAKYALFVHESKGKWLGLNKPRPKRGKGKKHQGVYWGPHGNPKFLENPAKELHKEMHNAILMELRK